ncbi:FAD binding domain-containing protein [Vararia minispora EC-137]|uniref:FAD binding domain-containing protein n=1 Tax=Vararia minispora EC-137 TaxID=1314806 RepID=A0ACB8R041_9AGAM|nr:FAD binding domain-containing protein [Vararia minispora EC-137]
MASPPHVLIVGGGPVGLVAALALALNGVSFRIVDKLQEHAVGQRGAGIAPRTLEIYHFLGVLKEIKSVGGPLVPFQEYDVECRPTREHFLAPQQPATPETPEPNHWMLGQDSNCTVLRKHLEEQGIEVELGTELVNFEQDEDGVSTTLNKDGKEERLRVKFLIGADGARGVTRKQLGASFLGASAQDIRLVIGDIHLTGVDRQHWHRWMDVQKNNLMLRPAWENPDMFFIVAGGPSLDLRKGVEDQEYLTEWIRDLTKNKSITIGRIKTLAEWRLNVRMVDEFRVGRVVLVGDAAHVHTPAGGQGLNSGVMDAMNVCWKLALICKNYAPESLLDSFPEERMPVIEEMLQMTTGLFMNVMKRQDKSNVISWQNPSSLRQLGVHYRWSSIVRDELKDVQELAEGTNIEPPSTYGTGISTRVHAGDRAPDAPGLIDAQSGRITRLFDIYSPTRHTVVVFGSDLAQAAQAVAAKNPQGMIRTIVVQEDAGETDVEGTVFIDGQGYAHRVYGVAAGVKILVVRPDGVVGGILKGSDGLSVYFSRIFSG